MHYGGGGAGLIPVKNRLAATAVPIAGGRVSPFFSIAHGLTLVVR